MTEMKKEIDRLDNLWYNKQERWRNGRFIQCIRIR
jgi:hypothetical protein